jgi:hypothetical protein
MASSDDSPLVAARPTRLAGKTLATTCTIVNDDQLLYRAGNGNIRLTLALSEAIKELRPSLIAAFATKSAPSSLERRGG